MHPVIGFLRNKERISILLISLFLIGFVTFLLISNYHSLQKLRDSSRKQYRYEVETRARNLSRFFKDQRQRIVTLSDGGRLELYFENKALGMSRQYGLRSAILGIDRQFKQLVEQEHLGTAKIYYHIDFYDAQGEQIAGSELPLSNELKKKQCDKILLKHPEGFYALETDGRQTQHLIFTKPYYFKAKYAGQIVAWLQSKTIQQKLLNAGRAAKFTGLLCPGARIIRFAGKEPKGFVSSSASQLLFPENQYENLISRFKDSESLIVFKVPVRNTAFHLMEIASSRLVIGSTSPRTLLLAMALLFVGLIGVAALLMRMAAHNIVLHTRFEEAQKTKNYIEQKNRQLKSEIEERKRSESARAQLEVEILRIQKMEVIGELVGGVAHDLNNILTGIVSYPDLLLMQLPENSSLKDPILTIKQTGQKATAIVQDLLTLARRGVVITKVVNINDVLVEYLRSPEHQKILSFHPSVHIETNLEDNLFNVLGSPVHLSKSMMNLVSNAAEAMPDGGLITISTQTLYIDKPIVRYEKVREGEYVLFSVSDTGSGMSSEDSEKIFEPFFTKKRMGRSGTGLGMSVVWGTVKDHGGYIDVQTALGKGTTFSLYFPVTRKKLISEKLSSTIHDYKGAGETILVVDDVEEQREIARMIFSQLGYEVSTVSSGEKAVEFVSKTPVALVILDMVMDPGIDGLETYKKIVDLYPEQKAIITSGFSETERVKQAQKLGARQYIRKPYTLEKIAIAVKNELHP